MTNRRNIRERRLIFNNTVHTYATSSVEVKIGLRTVMAGSKPVQRVMLGVAVAFFSFVFLFHIFCVHKISIEYY